MKPDPFDQMLDDLVKRGLIERTEDPKRGTLVRLTARGKQVADAARVLERAIVREVSTDAVGFFERVGRSRTTGRRIR